MLKAVDEVKNAGCNALVVFLGNFGPETSETLLANLSGEEASEEFKKIVREKKGDSKENNRAALGTTPRQLTDLIGSLCDLTSGSGDKGTPVVLVQNYFKNYAD